MIERRVLFDTNIYGRFFEDREGEKLASNIKSSKPFIIHNYKPIRNELRAIPQRMKIRSKSLKIAILELYDTLVSGKIIFENKAIISLAEEYYKEYKKLKGKIGKEKIIVDFRIVACASLHNMDVIYSEDENSLKCNQALRSYEIINIRKKLRTPSFTSYTTLKMAFH